MSAPVKVVYNACYGGFSLDRKAVERMADLGSAWAQKELAANHDPRFFYSSGRGLERHDPILVAVVEEMGDEASKSEKLRVIELLGRRYKIEEYDGLETVIDPEDYDDDWIMVP